MRRDDSTVEHYDAQYGNFASDLYAQIRSEAFGEDLGQNGWLTREEQDLFIAWLGLEQESTLLDIACGSGGPTLRIARLTGCSVVGIDVHEDAIASARARAEAEGLGDRARFEHLDGSQRLPFESESFDGVICVDAVNHLAGREQVFREWARVLRPGGRLVFTDPIVVTGPLTNEEIAIRSSIGFFLFVPAGADDRMLAEAGFEVLESVDRTRNIAETAARWRAARQDRAAELIRVEGEPTFSDQQRFFEVAARIAQERRLSRIAFHARRG